jgi:cyanophycinase-like exopeptidase
VIAERYHAGAVLVGVSAGAVQLGLVGWPEESGDEGEVFGTLGLVPMIVDAHDEPGWQRLRWALKRLGGHVQGLGIPRGAGAVYHPDRSLEPVRRPLVELVSLDDGIRQTLLFPPGTAP